VVYNLEWQAFANLNMGVDNGDLSGPMDENWENTSSANVFGLGFSGIERPGHAGPAEAGHQGIGWE
jgi:hypothetical protein